MEGELNINISSLGLNAFLRFNITADSTFPLADLHAGTAFRKLILLTTEIQCGRFVLNTIVFGLFIKRDIIILFQDGPVNIEVHSLAGLDKTRLGFTIGDPE